MTPEETAALRQKHYNATLVWQRRANPDLAVMRVRPDFPLAAHKPGQYCTLGLGGWEPRAPGCQEEHLTDAETFRLVRRAYSIGCSVLDESGGLLDRTHADWLEFYIVLVRESDKEKPPALTPRLFLLGEGDRLFAQPSGQSKLEILPESETEFFIKSIDATLRFVKDDQGKVTHVVVRRGSNEDKAKRVEGDEPKAEGSEAPKGEAKPSEAK